MSFGKMNTPITIVREELAQSSRGFTEPQDMPIAACKAYYEPKHGSAKWANLASFSTATALFRFRKIHGAGAAAQMELPLPFAAGVREEPSRVIDTSCFIVCKHGRFRVLSVDDVHSKGLYYECLTDQVDPAVR